ncbi:hypothetical protein [Paenibacillus luteus]|nr:hypothetical protein [Paenibacillus luteus]
MGNREEPQGFVNKAIMVLSGIHGMKSGAFTEKKKEAAYGAASIT